MDLHQLNPISLVLAAAIFTEFCVALESRREAYKEYQVLNKLRRERLAELLATCQNWACNGDSEQFGKTIAELVEEVRDKTPHLLGDVESSTYAKVFRFLRYSGLLVAAGIAWELFASKHLLDKYEWVILVTLLLCVASLTIATTHLVNEFKYIRRVHEELNENRNRSFLLVRRSNPSDRDAM